MKWINFIEQVAIDISLKNTYGITVKNYGSIIA